MTGWREGDVVGEGALRWPSRAGRVLLAGALLIAGIGVAAGQGGATGVIQGRLFTAQHPDSVAAGAELTLIFRLAGTEEVQRLPSVAALDGSYRFEGVATDPAVSYVIRVHHFGRDFLGAPIAFEAGSSLLEFNFLVSRDAQPMPLSDGHSHPGGIGDPLRPISQSPLDAIGIVVAVLAVFAVPFVLTWRRESPPGLRIDGSSVTLMRDIASLDLRFAGGEIEERDYRSVRSSLFKKLQERTGAVDGQTDRVP